MASFPTSYRGSGPQRRSVKLGRTRLDKGRGNEGATLTSFSPATSTAWNTGAGLLGRPVGQWYMPARRMAMWIPRPPYVFGALLLWSLWENRERLGANAPLEESFGITPNWAALGFSRLGNCGSPFPTIYSRRLGLAGGCGGPPSAGQIANANGCLAGQAVPASTIQSFNCSFLIAGQYPPLSQFQILEYWWRAGAVSHPPIPRAVRAVAVASVSGLSPAAVRPVPVSMTQWISAPTLPEQSDRGYRRPRPGGWPIGLTPIVLAPIGSRIHEEDRRTRVRIIQPPAIPDVKTFPPNVEKKVGGRAFVSMMKALSVMGATNSMMKAFWRSIPAHLRTPNARTYQQWIDVARNLDRIDMEAALLNTFAAWSYYRAGSELFGRAQEALTRGLGVNAGFGLYRAWANGERAFTTGPGSFNPLRTTDTDRSNAQRFVSAGQRNGWRYNQARHQMISERRAYDRYRRTRFEQRPSERKARLRRDLQRIQRFYDARRRER